MKRQKSNLITGALVVLFLAYTGYTFKYNSADFSGFTDALTTSVKGIGDIVSQLMPDFSKMNW
ncbi:hypothetical protein [Paenibacillus sp. FSL H3-0286]|uniref:hypothetical protein n=1 Tax=Paenibacillus sp. FSL H3-0286 TaxID=2921427 RepID=UPI00324DD80F